MNGSRRHEPTIALVTLASFTLGLCATLYVVSLLGLRPAAASESRFAVTATVSAPPADSLRTAEPGAVEIPAPIPADSLELLYEDLRGRRLLLPVADVEVTELRDHFYDARADHVHHAIDILAPRDTPVRAVEDGTIARLYLSNGGGGIAIYQLDPTETFAYYYAHLERWAGGIAEGDRVSRGQTIGYVGTSGNAPPGTPHLHFAITRLGPDKRWWSGSPLNPYLVFQP
jgi:murein DD-endopeptidase MepM/ murein hydrolase activator NlpD